MRVLMASSGPETGGVADHVHALSEGLRDLDVDVTNLWGGTDSERLPGGLRSPVFSVRVGRELRRKDFDVVHTHCGDGCLLRWSAPRGVARVSTSHGDERELWRVEREVATMGLHHIAPTSRLLVPGVRLPLFARAMNDADVVIALHDGEAATLAAGGRRRVVVIPNGVERRVEPAQPVPGTVAFVGSWIWRKGTAAVVDAFEQAHAKDPALRLVLAGPGPESLTSFADAHRTAVDAKGWLDHDGTAAVLGSADVLLLPSWFEGMPLVALQAMAQGVPVIGSDIPSIRATVGDSGVLIRPGDGAGFAAAILDVVHDRSRRDRLSEAAKERAATHTWAAAAAATLEVYDEAIGIARARRSR